MQKMRVLIDTTLRHARRVRGIAVIAVVCCLAMSGCSNWIRAGMLQVRPFTGFKEVSAGSFVHVEETANLQTLTLAQQLHQTFSLSQTTIEHTHGASLKAPAVYVCATEACYANYVMITDSSAETGQSGSTVVLNAVRLLKNDSGVPIFTHELSHIFWYQHGQKCAPRWWLEGMAVATSGGGAESVNEAQARQLMREGQAFHAALDNGCFNPSPRGTLSWAAYYRQAAMFVNYLREDEPHFTRALERIRSGERVGLAFQAAYGQPVATLWAQWHKKEMALAQ